MDLCGYTQPNAHITTLKSIKGCTYFLNDYPLNVPKTEFDLSPLYQNQFDHTFGG
jgi:hypothetical protein